MTVAVVGYASADRAVSVSALPDPDTTAVVRARLGTPWPRLGGCGPVIATHLARAGVAAGCVSWLADDALGHSIRQQLEDAAVDVRAVARRGTRTAESYLVYAQDGRSICVYDPGDAAVGGLTERQRATIAAADAICLTVAPAEATAAALDLATPAASVVWSVKADPDAYPPALVARLVERADVVTFAQGERGFLTDRLGREPAFREEALVVETRGARGVLWAAGADSGETLVEPLDVADTTGAGDAFVGGLLARLIENPGDAAGAVAAGVATSHALLRSRLREVHV